MKEIYNGEQLYIIGLTSLKRLGIRFIPLETTLSSIPQVNDVFIVGRNNPITQIPSGYDTLSFTLDFIAETPFMEDVRDKCNWLRSLRYNNGMNQSAEKIKLVWGGLHNREIWVVKNCVIKYSHFHRSFNLLPKAATVELLLGLDGIGSANNEQLKNYTSKNILRDDIQNLSGSGGMTDASLNNQFTAPNNNIA